MENVLAILTSSEVHVNEVVGDDGHGSAAEGVHDVFPVQMFIPRVLRMYRDRRVSQHCFQTRRSHNNLLVCGTNKTVFKSHLTGLVLRDLSICR